MFTPKEKLVIGTVITGAVAAVDYFTTNKHINDLEFENKKLKNEADGWKKSWEHERALRKLAEDLNTAL